MAFGVKLATGGPLDASVMDQLLYPFVLDVLRDTVTRADQPNTWASGHVKHAIDHLQEGEFLHAWPPLVTGVEGLFWGAAMREGYLDGEGNYTPRATKSDGTTLKGRPRAASDVIGLLTINERVKSFLNRHAFGTEANAYRHGLRSSEGERWQCLIWLLALVAFADRYWQGFPPGG